MTNGTYGIMMNGTFAKEGEEEPGYSVNGYLQIMLWYEGMSEPYTIMYHYEASSADKEKEDR